MNFYAIATHPWAYPALEVVHLLGVGLILGNLVLLELRVFGLGRQIPIAPLAALGLPLVIAGACLAAGSGIIMFTTQPAELLANRAFTMKLGLLLLAACNAAWFHARGSLKLLDGTARLSASISLILWLAILALGRWIAYY